MARSVKLGLGAILLACFTLGAFWTWRAPGGLWKNNVLGFEMWLEPDPGGWYIPAAHELFSRRGKTCFAGHPGTPLTLMLQLEQLLLFGIGRLAETPGTYTQFVARNIHAVWISAKLGIVVLHLLSFLVLYEYSRIVTGRADLALRSVLIYATSFPVLYYLNRVSVEPFMILFFLATVVCLTRAEQASPATPGPDAWAALAGFCAVSALFSKLHLMAPWPAFAGAGLALGWSQARQTPWRRRLRMLGAYGAGAVLAGMAYSPLVDWPQFARTWGRVTGAEPPSTSAFFLGIPGYVTNHIVDSLGRLSVSTLRPDTAGCFFFLFELFAAVAVVVGMVRTFRAVDARTRLTLWMLGYSLVVGALWFCRSHGHNFRNFHYLFPVVAAAAPLAALGAAEMGPPAAKPPLRRWSALGVGLLVLHGAGFLAVWDSKRRDADAFHGTGTLYYFAALEKTRPGERLAVFGSPPIAAHGLSRSYAIAVGSEPGWSTLIQELDELLVWESEAREAVTATKQRDRPVAVVLDFTLAQPGPWAASEWQAWARFNGRRK